MENAKIEAASEIYNTAIADADMKIAKVKGEIDAIKDESTAIGILKKIAYDNAHNEMIKYATLYQIKQSKLYKKGGMTWEDFCECVGEQRRNVGRILEDMKPVYDEFQDKLAGLINMPFNKIRHLGRNVSDKNAGFKDGCLLFDGEKIPLTPENREEIEAAIDSMKETHKKKSEDSKAAMKAKDRVLEAKQKVIINQEEELSKFTQEIEKRDYKPGEKEFIKKMEIRQVEITGMFLELDPEYLPGDATPLMVSKYIEVLGFFKRTAHAYLDTAVDLHGQPDDMDWQQPDLTQEDKVLQTSGETTSKVIKLVGE